MILIFCPHCSQLIEIIELNCCIFRCGIFRHDGSQIPPHLPKIECDRLIESGAIFGCGKPFRVEKISEAPTSEAPTSEALSEEMYVAVICDYI